MASKKSDVEIAVMSGKKAERICIANRKIVPLAGWGLLPTLFFPENQYQNPPKVTVLLRQMNYNGKSPYLFGRSVTFNITEFTQLLDIIEQGLKDAHILFDQESCHIEPLKDDISESSDDSNDSEPSPKRGRKNKKDLKKSKKKRSRKSRHHVTDDSENDSD